MTHHPIKVLEDGTRVYSTYNRYKPVAPEDRKHGVNKPDDPQAVRFHTKWFLPLEVLPDDERGPVPATRPDEQAYDHAVQRGDDRCKCVVCSRPTAQRFKNRWRQENGLKIWDR